MCGVVGCLRFDGGNAVDRVFEGLQRLEYRGYDSAGLAALEDGRLRIYKEVGKLANLEQRLSESAPRSALSIGHTRWATHGIPSGPNAHPHTDSSGRLAVVHNGIIENYLELKIQLQAEGRRFTSETDTEVLAHLFASHYRGDLVEAVRAGLHEVQGAYAIVVIHADHPGLMVGARKDSPLILGLEERLITLASDVPAFLRHTNRVIFLHDGEMVRVDGEGFHLSDLQAQSIRRAPRQVDWNPVTAEKGGYRHFLLKEIHEQPQVFTDVLLGRARDEKGEVHFEDVGLDRSTLENLDRIVLLACGTSRHAGMAAQAWLEKYLGIPAHAEIASEFRYRDPIVSDRTLAVAISQSGETADTLAALREAGRRGARTLAVCNVVGSSLTREADDTVYLHAGPEISVASTKTFTATLLTLYLLALDLAGRMGRIASEAARARLHEVRLLRNQMEHAIVHHEAVEEWARKFHTARHFLFIGRGPMVPIALEGALKLKEISYIHAEGHAAGELKHGPIALIDRDVPTVVLAPEGHGYDKVVSNAQEILAREGPVLAVVSEDDRKLAPLTPYRVALPRCSPELAPILFTAPLQLLSYYIADRKGCDVDQPRNLAKSVTVE